MQNSRTAAPLPLASGFHDQDCLTYKVQAMLFFLRFVHHSFIFNVSVCRNNESAVNLTHICVSTCVTFPTKILRI